MKRRVGKRDREMEKGEGERGSGKRGQWETGMGMKGGGRIGHENINKNREKKCDCRQGVWSEIRMLIINILKFKYNICCCFFNRGSKQKREQFADSGDDSRKCKIIVSEISFNKAETYKRKVITFKDSFSLRYPSTPRIRRVIKTIASH